MNEQEFWAALKPIEIKPILYRLYYDDHGAPLFYSQEDLPGNYIDIDREIYLNPPTHVKVVNNSLKILNTSFVKKLTRDEIGTACHPQDISVIVNESKPHIKWTIK